MNKLGWVVSLALATIVITGAYAPSPHHEAHASLFVYSDAGSNITITDADTYYKFEDFTVGTTSMYAVASAATDNIIIQTGGAGEYDIFLATSSHGSNGVEFEGAVFVNNNEIEACCFVMDTGTPALLSSGSAVCTTSLADGDVLDFRAACDADTKEFSIHRGSMVVKRSH